MDGSVADGLLDRLVEAAAQLRVPVHHLAHHLGAHVARQLRELLPVHLRKSNVLNLTWAMVTPEVDDGVLVGGELRLPSSAMKNKRPLTLPLTGRLLDLFARRWALRLPHCPYVFHRFGGRRVSRFDASWKASAAAIGQPNLLRHDLRPSDARTPIRAGVPEDVVMKLGGWKTRSMLSRYNVTSTDDLAAAQETMTRAFAAAGPRKVVPLRKAEN